MITGISKSRMPVIFRPIINSSDAIISVKYPPKADAKTLPVIAHIMPIIVNTIAVPRIKLESCKNVLNGVSLEHPPTYPIINGSIAIEHGDIDAIIPPVNAVINISIKLKMLVNTAYLYNVYLLLFFY